MAGAGRDSAHVSGFVSLGPDRLSPYAFSGSFFPALKASVRQAMLTEPEPLAVFLASQYASGILPVSHAEYVPLLRLMEKASAAR
ncbi:phosphonate transport system substrate-binding protein [Pseudomonas cuatrocienegasensis]|uniref:Phosphonate transport system substrate-binding protein n=1 Tax=Pseudomonas cuatrocienegasensis TaxID=543360 RepID=A0ABY1BRD5_9PSED|nr:MULTISPECIES: hypothetical protein [Pseudomonas]OEC32814.1 hypothetical protein A7D25_22125 [Pseudomonas sp. 21C1]SER44610.1 phosphonate transport system substrate-binding protein [Pseudomonas cuatrocienegasensis]